MARIRIPKNKVSRDLLFKRLMAKARQEEEKRHRASLKSLMLRAKLNRVSHLGF